MNHSDQELIELHKRGDGEAFSTLVNRWATPVYNFVYSYVRSEDDADDITQETFLRIWKNISKFETSKKWKTWIFTIAKNAAFDHLRKKKLTPFSSLDSEDDVAFEETVEDQEPGASELFDRGLDERRVRDVVDSLRPEYQSVLFLHYHQELTFDEISSVMNKPMNTVKSWHRRGLAQMKKLLGDSAPN